MTPLRQAAAATNEEERIIATKEVEKIFSRELSLLQTMHSHLLKELKVSTTSSEFIDAFFSFVPYLKVTSYHPRSCACVCACVCACACACACGRDVR
jgi:hypothetical protein